MKSFAGILSAREIEAVAAFVEREFVRDKAPNTAYHTPENGWPRHERFAGAFPFARGEIALDAPLETLGEAEREGRRLFLGSCISCHDRARVADEGPAWSSRPVSYPRMGFEPGQPNTPPVDAVSSASVYAKHEVPPSTEGLTPAQRRGAALFQANCAFCHGADGTGKNWIGQFMEPKARDLTQYTLQSMPRVRLEQRIREGLPNTSMPAWQHVLSAAEIRDLSIFVSGVLYQRQPFASAGR
jgi:cytochrome c oxidase cbb3-type subunit 3